MMKNLKLVIVFSILNFTINCWGQNSTDFKVMDFTALENSLLVKQMVTEKDWAEYDSVAYRIGKVYIDKFVGVLHRCERACMSEKQMKEIQNYLEEFQAQIEDFKPK